VSLATFIAPLDHVVDALLAHLVHAGDARRIDPAGEHQDAVPLLDDLACVAAGYLFTQGGNTWTELAELEASDGTTGELFGSTVSVSGNVVLVGDDVDHAIGGSAYVFEYCVIGGTAYDAGAASPADPCQACTPALSTTAWSTQGDGAACDDGDACTQGDTCQGGACVGGSPVVCTVMGECHELGTCDPAVGCSNPVEPDGTACAGGVCDVGVCIAADGGAGAGGGGAGGSSAGPGSGTVIGGCACSTAPGSSPPIGLSLLGALLGLAARRRPRARFPRMG
jgi:MYXO-CTERM domain-containing protein